MPKNKRKLATVDKSKDISLRTVKRKIMDNSDENSFQSQKRPIRQAVLNHKILGTPKIVQNEEDKLDKNNNATVKMGAKIHGQLRGKFKYKNPLRNEGQSRSGNAKVDLEQTQDSGKELCNRNRDNHDDSDLFSRFDRMENDLHLHVDDDIVDVTVDRGEDQDFGLEPCTSNARRSDRNNLPGVSAIADTTEMSEKELLNNHPYLEQLLQKIVDDKVEKTLESERRKSGKIIHDQQKVNMVNVNTGNSPLHMHNMGDKRIVVQNNKDNGRRNDRLIKSPSDTTLYAPALRQNLIHNFDRTNQDFVNDQNANDQLNVVVQEQNACQDRHAEINNDSLVGLNVHVPDRNDNNRIIDQISDFVEGIRINTTQRSIQDDGPSTSGIHRGGKQDSNKDTRDVFADEKEKLAQAKTRANRLIIEAEQYRAQVETPKGMSSVDEDFFHISCHIDQSLKQKIEKGEFVELERLLPKNTLESDSNEDRMELVNRDGQMYFVPAINKDNKIRNVRKWEQAFRVYAAIYSAANPHRSHEIWQYVYVINSAASCYIWEEVAQYDFMFRQLMARNPGRSWAVTYTQMWQMTLRHTIAKGGSNAFGGVPNQNQNQNPYQGKKKKYCWRFNRGKCTDSNCKYPHKCYYCDGRHGIHTCYKKGNKKQGGDNKSGGSPTFK